MEPTTIWDHNQVQSCQVSSGVICSDGEGGIYVLSRFTRAPLSIVVQFWRFWRFWRIHKEEYIRKVFFFSIVIYYSEVPIGNEKIEEKGSDPYKTFVQPSITANSSNISFLENSPNLFVFIGWVKFILQTSKFLTNLLQLTPTKWQTILMKEHFKSPLGLFIYPILEFYHHFLAIYRTSKSGYWHKKHITRAFSQSLISPKVFKSKPWSLQILLKSVVAIYLYIFRPLFCMSDPGHQKLITSSS